MDSKHRLLWVVPEHQGGIRAYADGLWPGLCEEVFSTTSAEHGKWELLDPWTGRLNDPQNIERSVREIVRLRPDLIHVQHEYALFGSEKPWAYSFGKWLALLKEELPHVLVVATLHHPEVAHPRVELFWRWVLVFMAKIFSKKWLAHTCRYLDGVIVHGHSHLPPLKEAGFKNTVVIPHYVAPWDLKPAATAGGALQVLVFGYFSIEKGQDLAIRAFARTRAAVEKKARLVLAGGARRRSDLGFFDSCRRLARSLGIASQVDFLGFVPEIGSRKLAQAFSNATLILIPTREATDRVSLQLAFGFGSVILASDIALHREIQETHPGSLRVFATSQAPGGEEETVAQAAFLLDKMLEESETSPQEFEAIQIKSREYAASHSPRKTAEKHLEFYRSLF